MLCKFSSESILWIYNWIGAISQDENHYIARQRVVEEIRHVKKKKRRGRCRTFRTVPYVVNICTVSAS